MQAQGGYTDHTAMSPHQGPPGHLLGRQLSCVRFLRPLHSFRPGTWMRTQASATIPSLPGRPKEKSMLAKFSEGNEAHALNQMGSVGT